MKQLMSLLVSLVLLVSTFSPATAAIISGAKVSGDYEYTVSGNEATVVYYNGNFESSATIPSKLGGKPVTEIAWGAFGSLWNLKTVTIPDSVTTLNDEAFLNCSGLTTVSIGTGVKNVYGNPFDGCTSLKTIKVHSNHKYLQLIDGVLFTKEPMRLVCYPAGKTGSTYTLPQGVTEIGDSAFSGNTALKTLVIPASVSTIHKDAFNNGYGQKQGITLDVTQNEYAKSYALKNNMKYVEQAPASSAPVQGKNAAEQNGFLRNGILFGDDAATVKQKENITLSREDADGIAAVWSADGITLRNVSNSTLSYCFNGRDELFQVYEYFNPNVSYAQGQKEYAVVQAELEAVLGKPLEPAAHVTVKTAGFDVDDYVSTVKAHKGDISITERDMWVIDADSYQIAVDHTGVLFGGNYKHYLFFTKLDGAAPKTTATPEPTKAPAPSPSPAPSPAAAKSSEQQPAMTEIHADKGDYRIRIDRVNEVNWPHAVSDMPGVKIITVQCAVENVNFSGIYAGSLSAYEIAEKDLAVEDADGFSLEFYDVVGESDGLYEVGAKIKVGQKKRVSLPFFVPEDCAEVTVSVGENRFQFVKNSGMEWQYAVTAANSQNEEKAASVSEQAVEEDPTAENAPIAAETFEIPGGRYTVGEDIPAGAYTISINARSTNLTVWGAAYHDYKTKGGLLLNVALYAEKNQRLGKVVLEAGNVIDFSSTLIFQKYTGLDFSATGKNIVPGGRYIVGEDIPAGTYTISIEKSSTNLTVWGAAYHDYKAKGGMLLNVALYANKNAKLGKVILNEGNIIDFTSTLVFEPYKGFGM